MVTGDGSMAQPLHLLTGLQMSQTETPAALMAALGCGAMRAILEAGLPLAMGYRLWSTNLVVGVVGMTAMVVE